MHFRNSCSVTFWNTFVFHATQLITCGIFNALDAQKVIRTTRANSHISGKRGVLLQSLVITFSTDLLLRFATFWLCCCSFLNFSPFSIIPIMVVLHTYRLCLFCNSTCCVAILSPPGGLSMAHKVPSADPTRTVCIGARAAYKAYAKL